MIETTRQEIYSGMELEISKNFEKHSLNVELNVTNGLKVIKHFLLREEKKESEMYEILKNNVSVSEPVSEEQIKNYEEEMDAMHKFYIAKIKELEEFERIIQNIKNLEKKIMEGRRN